MLVYWLPLFICVNDVLCLCLPVVKVINIDTVLVYVVVVYGSHIVSMWIL